MSKIEIFNGNESRSDYKKIAFLHKQAISGGFLASLDYHVLVELYRAIAKSPHSLLWVSLGDGGEIEGFIALSFSTSKLYKEFIIKRSLLVLPYLVSRILSIRFIRKIFEVLVYPVNSDTIPMPETELLNFCVDESLRGKGTGRRLFSRVEDELRSRQIISLKIVTGENQTGAQNFYEKRGAHLLTKHEIHKGSVSYIYQYDIN